MGREANQKIFQEVIFHGHVRDYLICRVLLYSIVDLVGRTFNISAQFAI